MLLRCVYWPWAFITFCNIYRFIFGETYSGGMVSVYILIFFPPRHLLVCSQWVTLKMNSLFETIKYISILGIPTAFFVGNIMKVVFRVILCLFYLLYVCVCESVFFFFWCFSRKRWVSIRYSGRRRYVYVWNCGVVIVCSKITSFNL